MTVDETQSGTAAGFETLDRASLMDLISALSPIDDMRARVDSAMRSDPSVGSRSAIDLQIPHARFVGLFAGTGVSVAVDHLLAWSLLVRGGVIPIYAPMTLLRGALEGALVARWLVDPRPAGMERVARGVAAQIEDWSQRRGFEQAAGAPAPRGNEDARSAEARLVELKQARRTAGIPTRAIEKSSTLAARYGTPGYGNSLWLYRLLSAFAHSKPWSLMTLTHGPPEDTSIEGVERTLVSGNDALNIAASRLVVRHVEAALRDFESYRGLGLGPQVNPRM